MNQAPKIAVALAAIALAISGPVKAETRGRFGDDALKTIIASCPKDEEFKATLSGLSSNQKKLVCACFAGAMNHEKDGTAKVELMVVECKAVLLDE